MSSPFDEAMARPLLDEPVRKKWCLSKPKDWFRKDNDKVKRTIATLYDDESSETITFLNGKASPSSPCSSSPSRDMNSLAKETLKVVSSSSSSSDTVEACCSPVYNDDKTFNKHNIPRATILQHPLDLKVSRSDDYYYDDQEVEEGQLTTIELIDLESADTDLEILRERESELTTIASEMNQIHTIQQGTKTFYYYVT